MVWVGGTLDMKSSKEVSSVVEDDWSEGMSLLVVVVVVAVPVGEERRGVSSWQRSVRLAGLRRLRCLEEVDSDARGANEFGLLKFVSGI